MSWWEIPPIPKAIEIAKEYYRYAQRKPAELVVFGLCALPYPLTWWAFFVLRIRSKLGIELQIPDKYLKSNDPTWRNLAARVRETWNYEHAMTVQAFDRSGEFAHLFGFLTSALLSAAFMMVISQDDGTGNLVPDAKSALAIGTAAAGAVAFALALGRILIRMASHDSNSWMFASATRTLLSVTISAFFVIALFKLTGENVMVKTLEGCALLGAALGLLGERALAYVTSRAEGLFKIEPITPESRVELKSVDGMKEETITRLAEEGVDSLHSLAFMPTPRLFFNTPFGLQSLCDWQDQALLIENVGTARAQLFRDQLMVRGAIDAQALAIEIFRPIEPAPPPGAPPQAPTAPPPAAQAVSGIEALQKDPGEALGREHFRLHFTRPEEKEKLLNSLGFSTTAQGYVAFSNIAEDEFIRRLKIFYDSAANQESPKVASEADLNKGQFGGKAISNSRELSANFEAVEGTQYYRIHLQVRSIDPNLPLTGSVHFYLHPGYENPEITVPVDANGVAQLTITAWGAFTVGAVADNGATRLELDLAEVSGASKAFYER